MSKAIAVPLGLNAYRRMLIMGQTRTGRHPAPRAAGALWPRTAKLVQFAGVDPAYPPRGRLASSREVSRILTICRIALRYACTRCDSQSRWWQCPVRSSRRAHQSNIGPARRAPGDERARPAALSPNEGENCRALVNGTRQRRRCSGLKPKARGTPLVDGINALSDEVTSVPSVVAGHCEVTPPATRQGPAMAYFATASADRLPAPAIKPLRAFQARFAWLTCR